MYFLNHHQILFLSLLLALINNAYSASRINVEGTKFGETEYINLFKIPYDYITSIESPGSTLSYLREAFDENPDNYWLSPEEGSKVRDPQTGITYNPLDRINITVTFKKKYLLKV